jgi:transcriptional regulator with PAS, ATPase and Fis domain
MVGKSRPMLDLYAKLDRVTRVDAPVLITGESGTGKELVARAIHQHSRRAAGPFVPVNCGGLPESLVHSELFGHERGSFTGAHQRKIGSIEAASGGTIFLDEIGDLPLELQANLLRFLQEKVIVRVGSTQRIPIDVRVIAATHVELDRAVREGRFREDLYYRLNVLHLSVPPLRERSGDIELLVAALFDAFADQKNSIVQGFGREAMRAMAAYSWPGNVRELMNRVQHAMIMSEHRLITPADLGLSSSSTPKNVITLSRARAAAESDVIRITLRNNANNVSRAARQLGISRVTLYRLMEKFGIDPSQEG